MGLRNLNELRDNTSRAVGALCQEFVLMTSFLLCFPLVSRTRFYYSKGIFLNYKTFSNFSLPFFASQRFSEQNLSWPILYDLVVIVIKVE